MEDNAEQIDAAIAALEAQRALLGDAVVGMAVAPLQEKLAALRERSRGEPQLKTVTVLFMDVVGSTRLSQNLDPEDVHAVMDSALERLTAIVVEKQGKVLQYAGDSLLAVFGGDRALEDDTERAVHAGLAILEEGPRLAERFKAEYALDGFDLRVGIHTGPVLLGGGIDAESSSRRSRSRGSPGRCAATWSFAPSRAHSGWPTAASKASRPRWSVATPSWRASPRRSRSRAKTSSSRSSPSSASRASARAGSASSSRNGSSCSRTTSASINAGRSPTATMCPTAWCATCCPGASRSSTATRRSRPRPSSPTASAPSCASAAPNTRR